MGIHKPFAAKYGLRSENGRARVDAQVLGPFMFTCASGPLPIIRSRTVYLPGRLIPDARPLPSGGAALPHHAFSAA